LHAGVEVWLPAMMATALSRHVAHRLIVWCAAVVVI
jgi:hypothetical protein